MVCLLFFATFFNSPVDKVDTDEWTPVCDTYVPITNAFYACYKYANE